MKLTQCVTTLLLMVSLFSCRSNQVLEPVDEVVEEKPAAAIVTPEPTSSPQLAQLLMQLRELGYQGIGLNYESDKTIAIWIRVFSHPLVAGRQIELIYTGMANAYDPKPKSLTIGGNQPAEKIVDFIKKNVPMRARIQ